ncbi:MAG: hypothetical protein ACTTKJ_08325, partial [Prevotella koreensis]|uniref:hypothetical protein n=1 Tax=Prevotella koreensis TaxID=2490854 RepID=UPI003FA048B9
QPKRPDFSKASAKVMRNSQTTKLFQRKIQKRRKKEKNKENNRHGRKQYIIIYRAMGKINESRTASLYK